MQVVDLEPPTWSEVGAAWRRTPPPGAWVEDAACAGTAPDVFTDPADVDDVAAASRVCAGCPVVQECAAYAAAARCHGVWGGQLLTNGRPVQPRPAKQGVT